MLIRYVLWLIRRLQRFARFFGRRNPRIAAYIAALIATLLAIINPQPEPEPQFDEQSVAGAWILEVNNQAELSCVLDGSGVVSTASNFFNNGGSYQVAGNGDFSMAWNQLGSSPIQFSGNFDSETSGTFTQPKSGNLVKVADRSAMSGLWYARYIRTAGTSETFEGSFQVDNEGFITSSSGDLTLNSGSIFIADGGVVMHAKTNLNNAWIEVACAGSGDTQLVTGNLTLDTGYGIDGTFIFQRDPFAVPLDIAGHWMWRVGGSAQLYTVFDDQGSVIDASNFFNNGGTYNLEANGDFTMDLVETGNPDIHFEGNFSSSDEGTFTTPAVGTMERIADPSAMSGLWHATWTRSVNADEILSGSFTVDSEGVITSSDGQLPLTAGRIYISNGAVVMHAKTTRSDAWVELTCRGTGSTISASGSLSLDSPNSSDGSFIFSRTLNVTKADMQGPWLLQINGQAEQYIVCDGTGGLVASNFFNNGGTYNTGGTGLTMSWSQEFGASINFTGTFTSKATANVTGPASGTLVKVSNPGALQGTWGGDLNKTTQTPTTRNITFDVDANGAITSSTGDLSITSGFAFLENGQVVIHAKTTNTDAWGEFHCWGTGTTTDLNGDMGVDSPFDDDGSFSFTNPPPVNN